MHGFSCSHHPSSSCLESSQLESSCPHNSNPHNSNPHTTLALITRFLITLILTSHSPYLIPHSPKSETLIFTTRSPASLALTTLIATSLASHLHIHNLHISNFHVTNPQVTNPHIPDPHIANPQIDLRTQGILFVSCLRSIARWLSCALSIGGADELRSRPDPASSGAAAPSSRSLKKACEVATARCVP